MKYLLCALLLPGLSMAAILPDSIGAYQRGTVSQPTLDNRPIWDECGLKNWESAAYQNGKAKFVATAYQLGDTTGALAAFDWQRPQDARPSTASKLAAETAASLLGQKAGNTILQDVPSAKPLRCFATDSAEKFERLGSRFLGRPVGKVELVDLGG